MSWIRTTLTASAFATGLVLSAAASAAIVVASSGPSAAQYPVGKKLADTDRITLRAGDSVTVLDKRGTKVLRGPGRLAVSQPGKPAPNPALAALTRQDAASRARTGAVRPGEVPKPISPNLWLVDLGKPGTTCVTAPNAVQVWRADAEKAATYRIQTPEGSGDGSGEGEGTIAFPAEAATANWDTVKAPISDGRSYAITPQGGTFRFVVLADPPPDGEGLAAALIEKGCAAQLDLLSRTLATR